MGNYYLQSLMQEHMDLLKQYGYWDHILNSQKQLIDEAASQHQGNGQNESNKYIDNFEEYKIICWILCTNTTVQINTMHSDCCLIRT